MSNAQQSPEEMTALERMAVYERPHPTCPHCGYEMDIDEMVEHVHRGGGHACLFALAKDEDHTELKCVSCQKSYWLKGGYRPHYTSAFNEDDL